MLKTLQIAAHLSLLYGLLHAGIIISIHLNHVVGHMQFECEKMVNGFYWNVWCKFLNISNIKIGIKYNEQKKLFWCQIPIWEREWAIKNKGVERHGQKVVTFLIFKSNIKLLCQGLKKIKVDILFVGHVRKHFMEKWTLVCNGDHSIAVVNCQTS